jgi:hypothetical protein
MNQQLKDLIQQVSLSFAKYWTNGTRPHKSVFEKWSKTSEGQKLLSGIGDGDAQLKERLIGAENLLNWIAGNINSKESILNVIHRYFNEPNKKAGIGDEWVSVDDMLPNAELKESGETGRTEMVSIALHQFKYPESVHVSVGRMDESDNWYWAEARRKMSKDFVVTHWMRLPNPPIK